MVLLSAGSLSAQTSSIWSDPAIGGEGKADPRQEFVSYVTRETAVKGDPNEAPHYLPLDGKWRVCYRQRMRGGARLLPSRLYLFGMAGGDGAESRAR